jgi:hypothetical protein
MFAGFLFSKKAGGRGDYTRIFIATPAAAPSSHRAWKT